MGVNMAGKCIYDDQAVQEAARQEIVRRYYDARCELRQGKGSEQTVYKLELLMQQAGITPSIRKVAAAANQVAEQTGEPAMAIELPDGSMVTGKTSELMGCSAAALPERPEGPVRPGGTRRPPHRPERHRAHPDRQGQVPGLQQPPAPQ